MTDPKDTRPADLKDTELDEAQGAGNMHSLFWDMGLEKVQTSTVQREHIASISRPGRD